MVLSFQNDQISLYWESKKATIEAATIRADVPKIVVYSVLCLNLSAGGSTTNRTTKKRKTTRLISPAHTICLAFFWPYTSAIISVVRNDQGTIRKATDTENGPKGMIFAPNIFIAIRKLTNRPKRIKRRCSLEIFNMCVSIAELSSTNNRIVLNFTMFFAPLDDLAYWHRLRYISILTGICHAAQMLTYLPKR